MEVNDHSLQGYSNHEAVEVLRNTSQTVKLCLERYLRGPKYEQLQLAIAASESRVPQPSSPSIASLPTFPMSAVTFEIYNYSIFLYFLHSFMFINPRMAKVPQT